MLSFWHTVSLTSLCYSDNFCHFDKKMKLQVENSFNKLFQTNVLTTAIYSLVGVHYVFNIEYTASLKNVYHFLEQLTLDIKTSGNPGHVFTNYVSTISCLV